MEIAQVRPHLWRWTAPHPDWRPEHAGDDGWEQEVGCTAIVRGNEFVLVDPLAPAEGEDARRFWEAVDRDVEHHGPPRIVLTVVWHRRSSSEIAERYAGTTTWVHERGAVSELGFEPTHTFAVGDDLPAGLQAFDAGWEGEVEVWSPDHRALLTGDVILGRDGGLRLLPDSWLPEGTSKADVVNALAPLLDLDVELVLPAHGQPVLDDGAAALRRTLTL